MRERQGRPGPPSARYLALSILNRADSEGAFLEPLLDSALNRQSALAEPDRRFLTDLVYGTVRMRNRLDWIIGRLYRGKPERLEAVLKNLLRLGLYQVLVQDRVPGFAAVHETVELAKRVLPGRENLVNAVLRSALRKAGDISWPDRREDPAGFIAVYHSHPRWLVVRWLERYGAEETALLCGKNNVPPPLTLRVHPAVSPDLVVEELRALGIEARRSRYAPRAVVCPGRGASVREYVLSRSDRVTFQDEASQLMAGLVDPIPGQAVLDLCAGTGRKTLQMAEDMGNRGYILAVDVHRRKAEILREAARDRGWSIVDTLAADGTGDPAPRWHGKFDRVLLDAPCTGSGTVRRKPEIRWRVGEGDMASLVQLQKRLLSAAARYVKSEGRIVYGTCSLLREENEDVVAAFLEARPDFLRLDLTRRLPGELLEGKTVFRTFPHRHDMDGFSAVVFQKT